MQLGLLREKLRRGRKVLQSAAAAAAKLRARWRYARQRFLEDFKQHTIIVLPVTHAAPEADELAR
jgi:Asp-tRNA(Asn)/Glu-tRNA(Gln) amidotransferase A subunit family amidase